MRKIFKGFTLVECIIALAVLAIASLTMAQIYASVSKRNMTNQMLNASLSQQMAWVEQYEKAEAYEIAYSGTVSTDPPHEAGSGQYVKIESTYNSKTYEYSYPVDIYVLFSRDADGDGSKVYDGNTLKDNDDYDGKSEDNYNLRYKYVLGHTT